MRPSPVTRIVGVVGLVGLGPIALALGLGHRTLPEAALATAVWFAAVVILGRMVRSALCAALRRAEHRARQQEAGATHEAGTASSQRAGDGAGSSG